MAEYDDTRYYDEYDDDRQYDHARDYDDYDEADRALSEQIDSDKDTAWKFQVHELAHALRESPLPGTAFSEEFRSRFQVSLPPLPDFSGDQRGAAILRNLFDDNAHENAKMSTRSAVRDIAWFGAKFLYWRTEALGRYCYNVNCLSPLAEETKRRGRPRYYCTDMVIGHDEYYVDRITGRQISGPRVVSCKEAGKKRRAYHEKYPNAARRLKPMLVPGIPFAARPDRGSSMRWGWRPPSETHYGAPWLDRAAPLVQHFDRWLAKHVKKKSYAISRHWGKTKTAKAKRKFEAALGVSVEDIVLSLLGNGHIFSREEQEAIEELMGRSFESLDGSAEPADEDSGFEPLPHRTTSQLDQSA